MSNYQNELISDSAAREAVVKHLTDEGYEVINTASGSGVPAWSRLELSRKNETLRCAVKVTTGGRISFTREEDGTYPVLDEVDWVIHVHRLAEPNRLVVSAFDADTVRAAFEANHSSKLKHGKAHIPSWLSPAKESGWRFVGSGFEAQALWKQTISFDGAFNPSDQKDGIEGENEHRREDKGIIDQIKSLLASHMQISPDQIEIDIRVRS